MSRAALRFWAVFIFFAAASRLDAGFITRNAIDSGWYNHLGGTNPFASTNYFIGNVSGRFHRDFFVFDLSGIMEEITGAELRLFGGTGFPQTHIRFWSVDSTPIADLLGGTTGVSIYNDLGNSTKYGTDFGDFFAQPIIINSFTLNATAVTDLESAKGGLWAVGGSFFLANPIFGNTDGDVVRQLVLTTATASVVPEPTSLTLSLLGGLCALGVPAIRRRAQKHLRSVD